MKLLKRILKWIEKFGLKVGRRRVSFKLRDGSFGGDGLTPEFKDASWEQIREAIYEGRGG